MSQKWLRSVFRYLGLTAFFSPFFGLFKREGPRFDITQVAFFFFFAFYVDDEVSSGGADRHPGQLWRKLWMYSSQFRQKTFLHRGHCNWISLPKATKMFRTWRLGYMCPAVWMHAYITLSEIRHTTKTLTQYPGAKVNVSDGCREWSATGRKTESVRMDYLGCFLDKRIRFGRSLVLLKLGTVLEILSGSALVTDLSSISS